eukprot:NODE_54_length_30443_cov_1.442954.p16 type:complete len:252 gc:universal NODE_54_length_30443_cov_1.442954:22617-23372(+)
MTISVVQESAIVASLMLSFTFVLILYADPETRFGDSLDPKVIKKRAILSLINCIASAMFIKLYFISFLNAKVLGFTILGINDFHIILNTLLLFAGPIYSEFYLGTLFEMSNFWRSMRALIFAPIFEEFVFRALIVQLWKHAGISDTVITFASPLMFGVAHIHHLLYNIKIGYSIPTALVNSIFQIFYTSIFGSYQVHAYLKTGNYFTIVLTHSFCNHIGFPLISTHFNSVPLSKLVYTFGIILFYYTFPRS